MKRDNVHALTRDKVSRMLLWDESLNFWGVVSDHAWDQARGAIMFPVCDAVQDRVVLTIRRSYLKPPQ